MPESKDTPEDTPTPLPTETPDPDEGRMSRWSRLKQAERETPGAPDAELRDEAVGNVALSDADAAEKIEEIDPEDLPDIDTLDRESDFTVFLQKGVPEMLQRKALRKLWRLDPAFGILDGMNDYDEDYSMLGIIAMEVKTAYRAGKGFIESDEEKFDLPEEIEAKKLAAAEGEDSEEAVEGEDSEEAAEGADAEPEATAGDGTENDGVEEASAGSVRKPGEGDVPEPDSVVAAETLDEAGEDEIGDGEDDV